MNLQILRDTESFYIGLTNPEIKEVCALADVFRDVRECIHRVKHCDYSCVSKERKPSQKKVREMSSNNPHSVPSGCV